MNIPKIIKHLSKQNLIQSSQLTFKTLKGGTSSEIIILYQQDTPQYVIKVNEANVLKEEAMFLSYYEEMEMLPNLLYVVPSYQYIVYQFKSGSTNVNNISKEELLADLAENYLNHYKQLPTTSGFGWTDDQSTTWREFLLSEVKRAKEIINHHLSEEDFQLILRLIDNPKRNLPKPYLLHGDCGIHNFLFEDDKLCGVIDPTPLIGPPQYDFIYAYCSSSPDDLTLDTIQKAAHYLNNWEKNDEFLFEEVLIGLYIRIARSILHHPNDLEDYLTVWDYWKNILKNVS
ncbi:aminoglycoside phosphotransferase family protein [Bacillus sp. 31A1R]|uniref:Aminoglycoside phosphotransferase family protein n=1 Tax=Robertmurraya mangrovi TaxID=3098077 RepID=A0ABU5IW52_9BACI|nr:aminoglycoside phosphotransferase family protein [Bacillus sp. 31A1R]MDZ5471393.1 aminoglycoside phosphotransferase family protein [Bacillus sp. 31A1R]